MLHKSGRIKKGIFAFVIGAALVIWSYPALSCGAETAPGIVDVGNFHLSAGQQEVPEGWQLLRYKGRPVLNITREAGVSSVRLLSHGRTAFGISREISVDVRRYPYLHWRWKALRLPEGGDILRGDRDDQALQIYLVFPGTGLPKLYKSPTVAYIWDNEAPKGLMTGSPQAALHNVRYLVLRNKTDALGSWHQQTRNILADYRKLFPEASGGETPGPARLILLFINTHHTKSNAEGHIGDIYFANTDQFDRP